MLLSQSAGLVSAADSIAGLVSALPAPRAVWVMVPAGSITEQVVTELLDALEPGDTISAFLRPNPAFHMDEGKVPVILVGAGSGESGMSAEEEKKIWESWGVKSPPTPDG